MKNTLKMLVLTLALGLFAVKGFSQVKEKESLYNSGEVGIGLGTSYSLQGGLQDNYEFNLSARAVYFPLKYVGISAELPFFTGSGVSLREVGLSLVTRVPVYKGFALQTSVGSYYAWDSKDFSYFVEPMLVYRFNPKWEVSAGGQYLIDDFKNFKYDNGNWSLRAFVTVYF